MIMDPALMLSDYRKDAKTTCNVFISQEIGVLVVLFCLFQAVAGLILPSLSRLRTMYISCSLLSPQTHGIL